MEKSSNLWLDLAKTNTNFFLGLVESIAGFMELATAAIEPFIRMQKRAIVEKSPEKLAEDTRKIAMLGAEIAREGFGGATSSALRYHLPRATELSLATLTTMLNLPGEDIFTFFERQANVMEAAAKKYPERILGIGSEFGFHFDSPDCELVWETAHFRFYRVNPTDKSVKTDERHKPVLLIPPYVLGANILAFLPQEGKSLAHCFANQGVPTYVRVVKDIATNPAVAKMTGENDVLDTAAFCRHLRSVHGLKVTIFGICQGGFMAALGFLTGKFDGVADQLITAVAPIDGSRSRAFKEYMGKLPEDGRDLGYSLVGQNGSQTVSGPVLAAVYKWRSFWTENPVSWFYDNLGMLEGTNGEIRSTAAAINYWLQYERCNLPPAIAQLALDVYKNGIAEDGTFPIFLFGSQPNICRMNEMPDFRWYLAYAPADVLVEKESALAPLRYLRSDILMVVAYPGGHVGIATTQSKKGAKRYIGETFPDGQWGFVYDHLMQSYRLQDEQLGLFDFNALALAKKPEGEIAELPAFLRA